jgi:DNA-binding transcriptional ArsR family regulator
VASKRSRSRSGKQSADELSDWTSALSKVLAHPTRIEFLQLLARRGELSPRDAATSTGVNLASVAYHVRELAAHGLVAVASTRPRRGAVQHFYRLTEQGRASVEAIAAVLEHAPRARPRAIRRAGRPG